MQQRDNGQDHEGGFQDGAPKQSIKTIIPVEGLIEAERNNGKNQEVRFEDEGCNECIEKITHLEGLIEIERTKLFKAMRKAKNNAIVPII